MPYITFEERQDVNRGLPPKSAGQLSYAITQLIRDFAGPRPPYSTCAVIAGVLVLTLFEFVRRVVNPYEELKKEQNGDVY